MWGVASFDPIRSEHGQVGPRSPAVFFPRALQGWLRAARALLRLRRRQQALLLRSYRSGRGLRVYVRLGLHPTTGPPHVPVPAARVRPDAHLELARCEMDRVQAECDGQSLRPVHSKLQRPNYLVCLLLAMGVLLLQGDSSVCREADDTLLPSSLVSRR